MKMVGVSYIRICPPYIFTERVPGLYTDFRSFEKKSVI